MTRRRRKSCARFIGGIGSNSSKCWSFYFFVFIIWSLQSKTVMLWHRISLSNNWITFELLDNISPSNIIFADSLARRRHGESFSILNLENHQQEEKKCYQSICDLSRALFYWCHRKNPVRSCNLRSSGKSHETSFEATSIFLNETWFWLAMTIDMIRGFESEQSRKISVVSKSMNRKIDERCLGSIDCEIWLNSVELSTHRCCCMLRVCISWLCC